MHNFQNYNTMKRFFVDLNLLYNQIFVNDMWIDVFCGDYREPAVSGCQFFVVIL